MSKSHCREKHRNSPVASLAQLSCRPYLGSPPESSVSSPHRSRHAVLRVCAIKSLSRMLQEKGDRFIYVWAKPSLLAEFRSSRTAEVGHFLPYATVRCGSVAAHRDGQKLARSCLHTFYRDNPRRGSFEDIQSSLPNEGWSPCAKNRTSL